jgi:hypothetical protein
MSGDSYRRVQSGQPLRIAADAWNEMLQVARDHRASNALAAGGIAGAVRDADIVLVKNEAGADVPRFGVLGIDGVIFTAAESLSEFQARIAFRGVEPALPDHRGMFVVCLEPIADGKIGRAWVSGVCAVRVQINSATHQYCDAIDGETEKLASSDSGSARILYREGTEGDEWCVVRLGDGASAPAMRIGQFTGAWYNEPGATGADNVKLVKLYVQPANASTPNDWVPELDADGEEVLAVTLNLFSYIPTRSGNDAFLWCAVVPLSDVSGEYWAGGYENIDGQDVPIMRPYSKLWLLLSAEC